VRELKQIDSHLSSVNRNISKTNSAIGSSQFSSGTVRGLLKGICKEAGSIYCSP
jgi:hypothetical protein